MAVPNIKRPRYAQPPNGGVDPSQQGAPEAGIPDESYLPPVPAPAPQNFYPNPPALQVSNGSAQQQAQQDRVNDYTQGASINQDITNNLNYSAGLGAANRNLMLQQYDPIWNGQGGYSPEDKSQIQGQSRLTDMNLTPQEEQESYLTPEEQAAIQGDPSTHTRAAVNGMKEGFANAVDPTAMKTREGFQGDVNGAIDDASTNVHNILDPNTLNVSDQFLSDYRMTPQQQQDMVTGAGLAVRNRYGAVSDETSRRARAEGMNPAGEAVMRARLERTAAGDSADAQTQARIAANSAAADRLKTGEDMRVRYGQNLAGMQSQATQNLAQAKQQGLISGEQARIAAEQGLAAQQSKNVATAGAAELQNEQNIDNTQSNRAGAIAANRQTTAQQIQQSKLARKQYIDTNLANRTTTTANAKRADEQEGRAAIQHQIDMANNNVQQGLSNKTSLLGTQGGLANQATSIKAGAEGTPGKGERVVMGTIGAAASAAKSFGGGKAKGGIVTRPTYVLVGESGPEAIVPLGMDDDAEVLPSLAMKPGSFDTAPPSQRKTPAYGHQYGYTR